jgi:hypothetical protein
VAKPKKAAGTRYKKTLPLSHRPRDVLQENVSIFKALTGLN